MRKHNKLLFILAVASLTLLGSAALSSARGDGPGGCSGYEAMKDLSPEVRDSIRKAHEALTPVFVQYWAKQAELSAKIYSGADDKTIQDIAKEVERLHSQLLEGRIGLQKQMAKAGLPMRAFHGGMKGGMMGGHGGMMGEMMGDGMECPGMGGMGGHGGKGGHGGMMGSPDAPGADGGMSGHGGHGGMMGAPDASGGAKAPAKGQK